MVVLLEVPLESPAAPFPTATFAADVRERPVSAAVLNVMPCPPKMFTIAVLEAPPGRKRATAPSLPRKTAPAVELLKKMASPAVPLVDAVTPNDVIVTPGDPPTCTTSL